VDLATYAGFPSWISPEVKSTNSCGGSSGSCYGFWIEYTEAIYRFDYEV